MLDLDPVTERSLIVAALSAGTIWGALKTTIPALKKQIVDLNNKVNRMQRTLDKLSTAHQIHHGENFGNGNSP